MIQGKKEAGLINLHRCVQINTPSDSKDDPAVWVEVINKLKESIVTAFDGAILEREEDVKRGESQRMTVGWNFCNWFLLKVSCLRQRGSGVLEICYVTPHKPSELSLELFPALPEFPRSPSVLGLSLTAPRS